MTVTKRFLSFLPFIHCPIHLDTSEKVKCISFGLLISPILCIGFVFWKHIWTLCSTISDIGNPHGCDLFTGVALGLYTDTMFLQDLFQEILRNQNSMPFHKAFGPMIISFFWKKKRETYKSYNISWQHKMNVTRFLFP